MRDGTRFTGDFQNGEITGRGVKQGRDGRVYEGEFLEGEMHGSGLLVYNSENPQETDLTYEGQFHLNQRVGQGVLRKRNGDLYTGAFVDNWPNGVTEI